MSGHRQTRRLEAAVAAFRSGEPVLVHDSAEREGETDLVYPAGAVQPSDVTRLRNDAGGLVCVAVSDAIAETIGLPFLAEQLDHPAASDHRLGYDERSSFSLSVNHRNTFTGITDEDRALTIGELANAAAAIEAGVEYGPEEFATEFRTPGHVTLLRGAPGGVAERRGHTELGLALAAEAGLSAAVVVCEMLDDETGGALPPDAAREYATSHDLQFLEGVDLLAVRD